MASRINADSSNGLQLVSDSSGEIQFQSSGITKATLNSSGLSSPGHVLQVVHSSLSTQVTSSSSTQVTTGLEATITPSSTSSKILIMLTLPHCYKSNASSSNAIRFELRKNDVYPSMQVISQFVGYTGSAGVMYFSVGYNHYDSPSTTSATKYTLYFANNNNGADVRINANTGGVASTITLMEIAG